jgi:N-formylglutamate deformylase
MTAATDAPFILTEGKGEAASLVLDSPHSGRIYPADFPFTCPAHWLHQTEDRHVDRIFADAPNSGAVLLAAPFARSYIDLNRAADDIDPAIIDGALPFPLHPTERSNAGHGLIRHLCRGQKIYAGKIRAENALHRLRNCYEPYHAALKNLLDDRRARFGTVWHLNCHSMPSHGGLARRADFVLGDRDGMACEPAFLEEISRRLIAMGYSVAQNDPYKGVEILRRTGKPGAGSHAVQLEVNRALYMNEETLALTPGFEKLQADMSKLIAALAAWTYVRTAPQAQAAE